MTRSLRFILLFFSFALVSLQAQTSHTVTTLNDEDDGDLLPTSGAGNGISLREAVVHSASGDRIEFAGSLDGGLVSLTLGQMTIDKDLSIDASALPARITIDGGELSRILDVTGDGMVTLHSLEMVRGKAPDATTGDAVGGGAILNAGTLSIQNTEFVRNSTGDGGDGGDGGFGGAILNSGTLNLNQCSFSENFTGDGQVRTVPEEGNVLFTGTGGTGGGGGAVANSGILNVDESGFIANHTGNFGGRSSFAGGGGAIHNTGTLEIQRSSFIENFTQSGAGGGIYSSGTLRILESTVAENFTGFSSGNLGGFDSGASGGGIANFGSCDLIRSTVAQNKASDARSLPPEVGFVINGFGGSGGGISNSGILNVLQSTITGNSTGRGTVADPGGSGGGIRSFGSQSELTIRQSTITDNETSFDGSGGGLALSGSFSDDGGFILIENTIVANNQAGDEGPDILISGSITSVTIGGGSTVEFPNTTTEGVNLIGDLTDSTLTAGPTVEVGLSQLAPLGFYGGATQTMPPLPGSAAIDNAQSDPNITSDQRDLPLPIGSGPDIGAAESSVLDLYPAHLSVIADATPTFTWNGLGGATYEVFLGTIPGSLSSIGSPSPATDTNLSISSTLPDDIYYWQVATTFEGVTFRSPEFSFANGITTVTNGNSSDAGSLQQAIIDAPAGTTIRFDVALSGETIVVEAPLLIDKSLAIDASNLPEGLILSGGGLSRIFQVADSQTLSLDSLWLRDGNGNADDGGAILSLGSLTLERCTLTENRAFNGGAIAISGNALACEITNCTLTDNIASNFGSAIANQGAGAALSINHSTISGNHSDDELVSTELGAVSNTGLAALITNSIVFGNTSGASGVASDLSGSGITLVEENIIGAVSLTPSGTNALNIDPLLARLGVYGGSLPTLPPLNSSPAIDAATGDSPATDQRGASRVSGADIGAVEVHPAVVTTALDEDGVLPGAGLSLREAVDVPFVSSVVFDSALSGQVIILDGHQIAIEQSLVIDASQISEGITIDGNHLSRIMEIAADKTVAIDSVEFINGRTPDVVDADTDNGGAILNSGDLYIDHSKFSNNATGGAGSSAFFGGGGVSGSGGAIQNLGNLSISESVFFQNSTGGGASGKGGGAISSSGSLSISQSVFSENFTRKGPGGAIRNSGSLDAAQTSFVSNEVGRGGGVEGSGFLVGNDGGGAILNTGSMFLFESTLSNNFTRSGNGGGIFNSGILQLSQTTLSANRTGPEYGMYSFYVGILAILW